MSFVKSKLKLAREALGKKEYPNARDAATQVLEYEPDNYNANVFLGLALLELGQNGQSEQAYRNAIKLNAGQPLAWQGISKFYERTEQWDKYVDTLQHLIDLYNTLDDATKCAESLQKLVEIRRERGTRFELVDALSYFLPASSIFPIISTLPPPDPTNPSSTATYATQIAIHDSLPILEEIIKLLEQQEEETLKKEVDKRRMRLGASGPEQLKKEVGKEIWSVSRLPALYNEILNHPTTSDDLRRTTESKLLRHKHRYLHALPPSGESTAEKNKIAKELDDLVNGAVILQIPDELAWMIYLEGRDLETITAYDHTSLRQFSGLFPESPLTSLLGAYFTYFGIPLHDENGDEPLETPEDDLLDIIVSAHTALPDSITANQALADVYLHELDYENAIKVADSGLELLRKVEASEAKTLPHVRLGFKVVLATSLVHLFSPKHHSRALVIIDDVLSQSPDNVPCLMGRGYILQAIKKWEEAGALFSRVDSLLPDDIDEGLRAREEHAWCQCQVESEIEDGFVALQAVQDALDELDGRETDNARCLWRLGKCRWDMGGVEREDAYRYFIASLKRDPSYAPAFTSLGVYYSEFANPLDPIRASKCFQKAFELDSREADAARRLAEGFAEDREWDLVEIVARRTIAGEGGLDAGLKGTGIGAARHLPMNAWAWKAVGVVEINRRNYPSAIQAFQIALRATPDDQLSWVRLGEAYSKAGRHAAAVKALGRAHDLQPDDWMCSYFIGEVQQKIGQHQEAIVTFESILLDRPSEVGVLVSLGQTYLDLGRMELSDGYYARAEHSFAASIRVALRTLRESPGFRVVAWKIAADAIFLLSRRSTFLNEGHVRAALVDIGGLLYTCFGGDQLSGIGIISFPSFQDDLPLTGTSALELAALVYEYRLSLGSPDSAAKASAWFDLGITLHSWAQQKPTDPKFQQAREKAIACLTQALREDPGNDGYWASFGDVNFLSQAKTAQHAYIKALEFDPKNVVTWTNLGLLYLHHNDLELANQALFRAQTLDPDYALAWIGQALVATANEHDIDAKTLLEHAVSLTASVPEADLEFALRVFRQLKLTGYGRRPSPDMLLPAFFALNRYCENRPDDASALHLFGLVCESLGQLQTGVELISRAIGILETAYEETEDPTVERHFTVATSNVARLRLALRDYHGAIEAFESALGLLAEDDGELTTRTLRAQAQFGSGLASFMQGDLDTALGLFEAALESVRDDFVVQGQVTVLLAQAMWAVGSSEFKEAAKAQLLECIATHPENLAAINVLAGMGILTEDDGLVDAALSEILALPLERRHELDPSRDVDYLLVQHHLGQGDLSRALSVAQGAVFAEPSQPEARAQLAALAIQNGGNNRALAILAGLAGRTGDLRKLPSLSAIARAPGTEVEDERVALQEAQRAIMLGPSELRNWQTLAYVRSRAVNVR